MKRELKAKPRGCFFLLMVAAAQIPMKRELKVNPLTRKSVSPFIAAAQIPMKRELKASRILSVVILTKSAAAQIPMKRELKA